MLTDDGVCVGDDVGLLVDEGEGDNVGVGDLVGVGVTWGVGVGVAVGALTKFAVIVPGPFIVADVEASPGISNVILPVLEDHEENV